MDRRKTLRALGGYCLVGLGYAAMQAREHGPGWLDDARQYTKEFATSGTEMVIYLLMLPLTTGLGWPYFATEDVLRQLRR